jgi:hypothetical protein
MEPILPFSVDKILLALFFGPVLVYGLLSRAGKHRLASIAVIFAYAAIAVSVCYHAVWETDIAISCGVIAVISLAGSAAFGWYCREWRGRSKSMYGPF